MSQPKFLIVLCPPRSFSSVVSTMIGQHPALYGFPELHLFIGDTVQEVLDREYAAGNLFGPPGVLRAIAQLVFGHQSSATILKAIGWLAARRHWSTRHLLEELRARVDPLIGMEKSPVTALKALCIERAHAFYPDAHYLHLTRHPVSTRKSMREFTERRRSLRYRQTRDSGLDHLIAWYRFHRNIMDFMRTLPPGQGMRLRGEDVLSQPDVYLPQVAEWLGVSTAPEAIEAMKHPERSPYAYRGPAPAHGGNDPNFMRNPVFRPMTAPEPSLRDLLATRRIDWFPAAERQRLAASGHAPASDDEIAREITGLSENLGYR